MEGKPGMVSGGQVLVGIGDREVSIHLVAFLNPRGTCTFDREASWGLASQASALGEAPWSRERYKVSWAGTQGEKWPAPEEANGYSLPGSLLRADSNGALGVMFREVLEFFFLLDQGAGWLLCEVWGTAPVGALTLLLLTHYYWSVTGQGLRHERHRGQVLIQEPSSGSHNLNWEARTFLKRASSDLLCH